MTSAFLEPTLRRSYLRDLLPGAAVTHTNPHLPRSCPGCSRSARKPTPEDPPPPRVGIGDGLVPAPDDPGQRFRPSTFAVTTQAGVARTFLPSSDLRRADERGAARTWRRRTWPAAVDPSNTRCVATFAEDAETSDMEAGWCRRASARGRGEPRRDRSGHRPLAHPRLPDAIQRLGAVAKFDLVNAAAIRLDLSTASFQPQLVTATALVRAGLYRRVLLVVSQAASRILDYATPGSTARRMEPRARHRRAALRVRSARPLDAHERIPVRRRAYRLGSNGMPQRRWWEGETGPFCLTSFDPRMGKTLGLRSADFCREACLGALAGAGLTLDDVWYSTRRLSDPGVGRRRLREGARPTAREDHRHLPRGRELGAVTLLFNLERAHRSGRLRDGDAGRM